MLFHIYMKTFPHWLGLPPIQRSPKLLYFESFSQCHSICHSIWHSSWHSIWPSIWYSIWHSIGHISWRSIWHSVRVWRAPESWRAIGYVPQNLMIDNHFPPTIIFLFGVFTIFAQNHTSYCWLILFPLPMPYPTMVGSIQRCLISLGEKGSYFRVSAVIPSPLRLETGENHHRRATLCGGLLEGAIPCLVSNVAGKSLSNMDVLIARWTKMI